MNKALKDVFISYLAAAYCIKNEFLINVSRIKKNRLESLILKKTI